MELEAITFNYDWDKETLQEFTYLRKYRLMLAREQMQRIDETVDDMITRNLLPEGNRHKYAGELIQELKSKILILETRLKERHPICLDEVEFYVHTIYAKTPKQ